MMFGQTGAITTTLSPGLTTAWVASIRALTPELVIASRSTPMGPSCSRVR